MAYTQLINDIKALPSADRKTGANGVWFTDSFINPVTTATEKLASDLDDLDFQELPDIKASAQAGQSAYDWLQGKDLAGLQTSADNGQKAWNQAASWTGKFAQIEQNAKVGQGAYNYVTRYNLSNIEGSAWSGASAWAFYKDKNFDTIANNAKLGAQTSATIKNMNADITWLLTEYPKIVNSAQQCHNFSADIKEWGPKFNGMTESAKSADKWNGLVTSVTNWNTTTAALNASAAKWDSLDTKRWQTTVSALKASAAMWDMVYASAGKLSALKPASATLWNDMVAACHTSDWNTFSANMDLTNANSSATKLNSFASTTQSNKTKWENMVKSAGSASIWNAMGTNISNWTTMTDAANASAGKWNTMSSTINGGKTNWNAAYNTAKNYSNYNSIYDNANAKWKPMCTTFKAGSANWNNMVSWLNYSGNNWSNALIPYRDVTITDTSAWKIEQVKNYLDASATKLNDLSAVTQSSNNTNASNYSSGWGTRWDWAYNKVCSGIRYHGYDDWNTNYESMTEYKPLREYALGTLAGYSANWKAAYDFWSSMNKYVATGNSLTAFHLQAAYLNPAANDAIIFIK